MVYNGKLLNKSSLAYVKTLTNTYKLPLLCKAGQIPSLAKGGGREELSPSYCQVSGPNPEIV